eukprot:scaffold15746_cov185-Skeletonema_menzelii.AAC.1
MNFNADDNVEVVAIDNHNHQDANNLPDGAATEEPNHQPASNKSTKILVGGAATALLVIATAFSAASLKSRNSVVSVQAQKVRLPKSSKIPTSKAGKKVCLEYGFETEVIAAGSATPIGASGPTGLGPCLASSPGVCCTEGAACFGGSPDACDAYAACLRDPANGPVVVGDWWLQRDVSFGEIFFEEDAVCGEITSTEKASRTRFELWDDTFLGMNLTLFKKFSVGYDFRSTGGGSGGYLNLYLRVDGNTTDFYDCNFIYQIPNEEGTGTLVVTPETVTSSVQNNYGSDKGCSGTPTILDYLADNPDAVMGVGNGGLYAFVLNTGSTNQDNSGQEICWSDASVQRYDETGGIITPVFSEGNYEFNYIRSRLQSQKVNAMYRRVAGAKKLFS